MGACCCTSDPKMNQAELANTVEVDKHGRIKRPQKAESIDEIKEVQSLTKEEKKELKQEQKQLKKEMKQEEKQLKKEIKQEMKEMKKEQKELKKQGVVVTKESKKDAKQAIAEKIAFKKDSLEYHQLPVPGKFMMVPTKAIQTSKDLAMAHTPGVAEPCTILAKEPELVNKYTNKGRTIACISDGTSVHGLGNIGALAAKPDLEGKAVVFKQFAGVDCVDLAIDTPDTKSFVDVVSHLAPSFGAINLESIMAPQCFDIEAELKKVMPIPVFHSDQHGTAAVVLAGVMNALQIKGKNIQDVKIVVNGAGAAGIASLRLLLAAGATKDKCFMCDTKGLIFTERWPNMNKHKEELANPAFDKTTYLEEVCEGADVLIGLSVGNAFTEKIMMSLNPDPIVFALSNPNPEIQAATAKQLRPDCIIATARPEDDNQIINVMCSPFVFRATLDTMSSEVNQQMILAAAEAIAELARQPVHDSVQAAQPDREFEFGPDYFMPSPLDPRLLERVVCKVAKAAELSGVAKNPIKDLNSYQAYLGSISQGNDQAHFVTGG